jgi:hypothetical protein
MLMRADELTKEQAKELGRHVKTCADCAAYMQETKDVMRGMKAIRSFEPAPRDKQVLTADILDAVDRARRNHSAAGPSFFHRLIEFLSYRTVRIVYGTFVLGSVGLFLGQQLSVATDVQSLEEKLVQRQEGKSGIQVVYAVPSDLVNRLPQSGQLQSYLETSTAGADEGLLVIDRNSISRAIDAVGSAIFRSTNIITDDASRKSLEALVETIQKSASARVTIRSKERS